MAYALLAGLILMTLGFEFITFQFQLQGKDFFLLGIMAVTWLFCGLAAMAETMGKASSLSGRGIASSLLAYSPISLGWLLAFLLVFVPVSRSAAARGGAALVDTVTIYYLFLFLAVVVIAIALLRMRVPLPPVLWRRTTWWLYPLLGLATAGLVFVTNLSSIQADIYYNLGMIYSEARQYDQSSGFYRRALSLAPDQPVYHLYLGIDTFARVLGLSTASQRLLWFEEARQELERARELSPLEPDYPWNLGDLYQQWAKMAPTPAERAQNLAKALEYYQKTVTLSPNSHGPRLKGPIMETALLLGDTYRAAEALEPARTAYEYARALDPQDYRSHKSLATLYQQWGRREEALAEARLARDLAPASEKPALEELIQQLEAQKP
ncbi:MAG: tetratricopeptide repeat protein [Acidobacteria bacterium]|nr:tetratricopeptide repeat protein [Acidobacteriota bacterium]